MDIRCLKETLNESDIAEVKYILWINDKCEISWDLYISKQILKQMRI